MEERTSLSEVAKVTAVVLLVYGLAVALVEAKVAILLGFFAIVLATLLSFPIDWMARRLPRWVAVMLTLLACAALVAAAILVVIPVVRGEIAELPGQLARARDRVADYLGDGGGAAVQKVADEVPKAVGKAAPLVAATAELVTTIVLVIVLSFFLASGRVEIRGSVRRLVPRQHLLVFDEWWRRSGTALRRWVGGILVSMTIMGTLAGLGLWAAGIPGAFLLGILTFFGTFVPYLGAVASALPGIAVALAKSPDHALLALLVYVGVHVVEGYLVQPLIMKRAIELKPALLLFWQAAIGMVFGIPGVIVATPLLAVTQASVNYLWIERRVAA